MIFRTVLAFVCFTASLAFGQTKCLDGDDLKRMLAQADAPPTVTLDQDLRGELLRQADEFRLRLRGYIRDYKKDDELKKHFSEDRHKNTLYLCSLFQKKGWPSAAQVGNDGVTAAFFLLRNSSSLELQRALLPVILAATRKNELAKADYATYIDRLRLSAGLKQLFGSEATVSNGMLVLYPIEDEAQVDARRKQFDLVPLAEYIRFLERTYQMPLVRAHGAQTKAFTDNIQHSVAEAASTQLPGEKAGEEADVIRIDTKLVNLNVNVYSPKFKANIGQLEQKDFAVFEDGRQEEISYFAAANVPFDLVLLLDLSGSTARQRDLIRQTTQRFVKAARPTDQLAIVTFTDTPTVVTPLTADRKKLLDGANRIEGGGGSRVWDALKYTLDNVLGPSNPARRRAVVFMTDGADNALMGFRGGSFIGFGDLLEAVRQNDALVIPIYLDTEGNDPLSHKVYEQARKALTMLAEESGGLYYQAKKIAELNGVYLQVIEDLGKVYSLGYSPTNDKRDGSWRTLKVQVAGRPELQTRTRPGYYAK